MSRGFSARLCLSNKNDRRTKQKKMNMTAENTTQEAAALRWFWNPPANGYSIEDCELFIRQLLLKMKNEEDVEE